MQRDEYQCQSVCMLSPEVMSNSATPWTATCQAPLSMGFSWQGHWSRFPFPSPEGLTNLGTEPTFPALAGGFFTTQPPGKLTYLVCTSPYCRSHPRQQQRDIKGLVYMCSFRLWQHLGLLAVLFLIRF